MNTIEKNIDKKVLSFHDFVMESYSLQNDNIKDYNFHQIPDGRNNYRSAQLPLNVFPKVCKDNQIKTILRLNWDGGDGKHLEGQKPVSIEEEKRMCEELGIEFMKLSSDDDYDQQIVCKKLREGNTLVHCAHGADRTGGAVGGYFFSEGNFDGLRSTEQIWDYSNQYNKWNDILNKDPNEFKKDYYLGQAKKFGVVDLNHAMKLAKRHE